MMRFANLTISSIGINIGGVIIVNGVGAVVGASVGAYNYQKNLGFGRKGNIPPAPAPFVYAYAFTISFIVGQLLQYSCSYTYKPLSFNSLFRELTILLPIPVVSIRICFEPLV